LPLLSPTIFLKERKSFPHPLFLPFPMGNANEGIYAPSCSRVNESTFFDPPGRNKRLIALPPKEVPSAYLFPLFPTLFSFGPWSFFAFRVGAHIKISVTRRIPRPPSDRVSPNLTSGLSPLSGGSTTSTRLYTLFPSLYGCPHSQVFFTFDFFRNRFPNQELFSQ